MIWTATQAQTWLAFDKAETWDELIRWVLDFEHRWRGPPPAVDVLRLLDARAGCAPTYAGACYPWHPEVRETGPGQPAMVAGWHSSFASPPRRIQGPHGPQRVPGAPELARAIRADHRRELGRLVSYAELAAMLRADLAEDRRRDAELDRADRDLRAGILSGAVTAYGLLPDAPNKVVALPAELAVLPIRFHADDVVPTDAATPREAQEVIAQRCRRVRFKSAEILPLRQMPAPAAAGVGVSAAASGKVARKHTGADWRDADATLVQRMKALRDKGEAGSATDAARAVVKDAAGIGEDASKVARLVKRYGETYGSA